MLNKQRSQKKGLVSIYGDIQNVSSIIKKTDNLLAFAQSIGRIIDKNIYFNSQRKNEILTKQYLELKGFKCVDVPDCSKNSADYRLIADCVKSFAPKTSSRPNTIILVLGDWDFAGLISMLKALGIKVIIIAQRGSASPKLIQLVGGENFCYVDELPQIVRNTKKTSNTVVNYGINYNDAIGYLHEAIKTAYSKGKSTNFSYLDNLMRQLYPHYQGVSSIIKPDGNKFSRFSKFIAAAVKDGKVREHNQKLFVT